MHQPRAYLARVVLDVTDMDRALSFWCAALGYEVTHRTSYFAVAKDPKRKHLPMGFQPTDERKRVTSPIHVEIFTDDMEREARRLEALGASRVTDWPYPEPDHNWLVLRDPDGHEICVCQMGPESLDF